LGKTLSGSRLASRFHNELAPANVRANNFSALLFELFERGYSKIHGSNWQTILARNKWFDAHVQRHLRRHDVESNGKRQDVFFAYSYSASYAIAKAKAQGYKTVLGQIDGGPFEEELMLAEQRKYPSLCNTFRAAPEEYWKRWRQELQFSDHIIVNSNWAMNCLEQSGAPLEKARIIPLLFQELWNENITRNMKKMPRKYSASRPLKVLYLGQVILRKGIGPLFDAIRQLQDHPIEFSIVGPVGVKIPDDLRTNPRFHLVGSVSRNDVAKYYEASDLFILPTISDGFALTQLEAQAYGLPIIVSNKCGEVIRDRVDGFVMGEVSAEAIVELLLTALSRPELLSEMSANIPNRGANLHSYAEQLSGVISGAGT
jgi:glycosyltransferase involved in cell wall biosynthesis